MRLRLLFSLVAILALTLGSSGIAHASEIVINNGLTPPNPANVIDHTTYSSDWVFVHNVGCPSGNPYDPCPSPGNPTDVALVAGGSVGTAVEGDFEVNDSSSITMTGGSVGGDLEAFASSTITMTGGAVGDYLVAYDDSLVTLSGGSIGGEVWAWDSSTITIVGSGFEVNGTPVPFGNLTALTGTLTGTLLFGDSLNNVFRQGGYNDGSQVYSGTITLVPEPSTAPLVGFGLLGLLAVGRRRRPV